LTEIIFYKIYWKTFKSYEWFESFLEIFENFFFLKDYWKRYIWSYLPRLGISLYQIKKYQNGSIKFPGLDFCSRNF
jgi:hypothetical protein